MTYAHKTFVLRGQQHFVNIFAHIVQVSKNRLPQILRAEIIIRIYDGNLSFYHYLSNRSKDVVKIAFEKVIMML